MAQPVRQVGIRAPGFQGLNTELSPINGDPEFALVADNVVVDQIGRLIAREAFRDYLSLTAQDNPEIIKMKQQATEHDELHGIHRQSPIWIYRYGSTRDVEINARIPRGMGIVSRKGRQIELEENAQYGGAMEQDGAVVELTVPAGDLQTAELVEFKDEMFLFAKGIPFSRLDGTAFTTVSAQVTALDGTKVSDIDGDIAVSAYGRLWVSGVNDNYHEIHYSSLLDETQWYDASDVDSSTGNTGGVINVREYWPVESDTIVGIHAHNGFLLVFGRNSILVYANANSGDPAGENGIVLQDAISNVGLVRRDAICNIGTDVLFVDDSGVRSIGRVIQEKSNPIGEPSLNIRRELQEVIKTELSLDPFWSGIKMEYMPSKSLAIMLFTGLRIAYVLHLNMPSKTGGMKITRWTECFWNDSCEVKGADGDLIYLGGKVNKGLLKYQGYIQGSETSGDPQPYIMRYESMALALGQSPMQTAIPKSVHMVCMGEFVPGQANALWGFSDRMIGSREFQIEVTGGSEYNVNEFTDDGTEELAGYYPDGGPYYKGYKINTTGSGELFRVGLEVKIQGGRYALQEIDINSAIGRLTA